MGTVVSKDEFELHRRAKMLGGKYDPELDAFVLPYSSDDTYDFRAIRESLYITPTESPTTGFSLPENDSFKFVSFLTEDDFPPAQ